MMRFLTHSSTCRLPALVSLAFLFSLPATAPLQAASTGSLNASSALATSGQAPLPAPKGPQQQFARPHFGYTLSLPASWQIEEPEAWVALFTPPLDSTSGPVSILIRNMHTPDKVARGEETASMAATYRQQVTSQASGGEILREAPFRWDIGESIINGRQTVSRFRQNGLPVQQWAIFLPSPYAPVVHLWLYTAPVSSFQDTLPEAQAILSTLRPRQESTTP